MVVEPANAEQVSELVKLANELKFALIPRGGASGLTGGSVPMAAAFRHRPHDPVHKDVAGGS